jgi:type VI secretion system protein VasD
MIPARILTCCGALLVTALVTASGCSSGPPKPTPVKAALMTATDVNPDIEGHPAPIVVRLYELKEEGAFNNTDYFRLIDREQEALGPSLVAKEEYELQPGESRTWDMKVPGEARFVGVAAGFRDLANSHWKALLPTPHKGLRTPRLTITVAKSAVSIRVGK